jgi:cell fate regulator YaaT (PSP1 superfamily)
MSNQSTSFVSVKFDTVGRVHRFLLPEIHFKSMLKPGDSIVVSHANRKRYGKVMLSVPQLDARTSVEKSDQVLRRASKRDVTEHLKQQHREREARRSCVRRIKERGLDMKLVRVEQQSGGARLVFYFTAESRIDFRVLVSELSSEFKCRIEMRQIGSRDETKLLGGYGTCGRPLCCTTWLKDFKPISIKMAKTQGLSLNPSRLSGLCGRLKCCLRYELPNAAGEQFAGCANESSCSRSGGCGSGDCGTCTNCG